jgi:hypothetical protein
MTGDRTQPVLGAGRRATFFTSAGNARKTRDSRRRGGGRQSSGSLHCFRASVPVISAWSSIAPSSPLRRLICAHVPGKILDLPTVCALLWGDSHPDITAVGDTNRICATKNNPMSDAIDIAIPASSASEVVCPKCGDQALAYFPFPFLDIPREECDSRERFYRDRGHNILINTDHNGRVMIWFYPDLFHAWPEGVQGWPASLTVCVCCHCGHQGKHRYSGRSVDMISRNYKLNPVAHFRPRS